MSKSKGHFYSKPILLETRQRRRSIHINLTVIHSIALLYELDGLGEEDIADYVLFLTYSKLPSMGWSLREGERITDWTLEKIPSDEFFGEPLYKLTVQTWQDPLPTKYPVQ